MTRSEAEAHPGSAATSRLESSIRKALLEIVDPCSIATGVPVSLVDMGLIVRVSVDEHGSCRIVIRLTSPVCWQMANIRAEVEMVVGDIPGVTGVECEVDPRGEWDPSMMSESARRQLAERRASSDARR